MKKGLTCGPCHRCLNFLLRPGPGLAGYSPAPISHFCMEYINKLLSNNKIFVKCLWTSTSLIGGPPCFFSTLLLSKKAPLAERISEIGNP